MADSVHSNEGKQQSDMDDSVNSNEGEPQSAIRLEPEGAEVDDSGVSMQQSKATEAAKTCGSGVSKLQSGVTEGAEAGDSGVSKQQSGTTEGAEAGDSGVSKQQSGKESLDDLFGLLKQQISTSDWLEKNTADKWVEENPKLAEDYMKAAKKT